MLRDAGKQVLFVTNNSTKSRLAFKKKFDDLGLPVVQVGGLAPRLLDWHCYCDCYTTFGKMAVDLLPLLLTKR